MIVAEEGFVLMEATLVDSAASEALAASLTIKRQGSWVQFPEYCVPVDLFASEIKHKFIEVPVSVNFVFITRLPPGINKKSGVFAVLPS